MPDRLAEPAVDNIRAIVELERAATRKATWQERVSDRISGIAGTVGFVIVHVVVLVSWAAWNHFGPEALRFDPYPYGLLTFFVSTEGVFIAIFVLIKQNRMSRQSDQRDHLNLQVDLLAEQEMTLMLRLLRRIADRLGVQPEDVDTAKAEKLAEETNVFELMRTLEEELPEGHRRERG